ncbi:UvrD-helicase domain-containing protein [bacterium]|nr:UvrD-helicase domain-containing protein [bacterium]MBU1676911.1 UvrD-helicase domain-containing protein [bacterium]
MDLTTLNERQCEAVTAPDGPLLVVAGAGTGKTRVLTTRIAWLLAQRRCDPWEILAFTFTNKAAREMRERVDGLVGEGRAPGWIGTFHATGVRILRSDGAAIGLDPSFSIYDTDDSTRLIRKVAAAAGVDVKQYAPNMLRTVISRWKNEDLPPESAGREAADFREEKAASVYAAYEQGLRDSNACDFDDLILKTVHLLEEHDAVREKYASRFRHVLVDEFQDTNSLQLILVKALSSVHGNIFAVGDDDQSIYSWRGARIENMLDFEQYFPGTRLVRLEQNYRSTGMILDAANAAIAHNLRRKGKNLWTAGAAGDPLREELLGDEEDEAARLVEIVREEIGRGRRRGDVTVLYRTNAQSRALEDSLRLANVPYQIVGATAFYERREVRDVLAYLKLVNNPHDALAALRVLNVPRRRIGDASAARLLALAEREGCTLGEAAARPHLLEQDLNRPACERIRAFFEMVTGWRAMLAGLSVPELVERVIEDVDFVRHLERDDPLTASARNENVAELVNGAYAFHEASDGGDLGQFLAQTALVADADTIRDDEGVVRLMTVHAAKGLEFPVVIVAGVEERLMPHASNLDDEDALEEERRLFYVALTRAQRRIHLLHTRMRRRFGQRELCLPSRFLGEIPDALIERVGEEPVAGTSLAELFGGRAQAPDGAARVRHPAMWAGATPVDWNQEASQEVVIFHPGQLVTHPTLGVGTVVRVEGGGDNLKLSIDFPDGERRHFLARFARIRPLDR